jgi:hypothetical protein
MAKDKKLVYDVKTGEQRIEEFEFTPPILPESRPISLEKIVDALLKGGIIGSREELEEKG